MNTLKTALCFLAAIPCLGAAMACAYATILVIGTGNMGAAAACLLATAVAGMGALAFAIKAETYV